MLNYNDIIEAMAESVFAVSSPQGNYSHEEWIEYKKNPAYAKLCYLQAEAGAQAFLEMLPEVPDPTIYRDVMFGRYQEAWQQLLDMRKK